MHNLEEAQGVLAEAEMLHSAQAVQSTFDDLAERVGERIADEHPMVISVMLGGLIPGAELLRRWRFPTQVDYLHATRYRGSTTGSELHWEALPSQSLEDRTVVIVDDILDEGLTLSAIIDACRNQGAKEVLSAVLVHKEHDRKPGVARADFTGLTVPDRYVFGCGMDYKGYWRNLPEIYAVKD